VQGLRIDFGDLFEEERVDVAVDRRGELQRGGVSPIDFECFVQIR